VNEQLGPYALNEVHCVDCLEAMRQLPDNSVDAVVTDPPYGIDLKPPRGRTQSIQGDSRDGAKKLWQDITPELYRVARDDTAHLFFGGWSEVWVKEVLEEWFTVKACIVWKKNVWGIGYYTRPQWELAWYCHKGVPPKPDNPVSDVWEEAREQAPIHSCQKPVPLMQKAISFVGGGLILDPFAGSGTTLVAAKQLGRRYLGFEIEPKYVGIARRRLAQEELFSSEGA
jgi:site-specific DNA-methyltransferase (adenine-specific)